MPPQSGLPSPTRRRILLVDCDMFYVQVARLEDPEGAGREPLLVIGGSPTGRGVVTSASYEVRAFGVRSGMPSSQARRLCPGAVFAPVDRRAVVRYSREVREALHGVSPVVQAASVDEFYLDLTGTERLFGDETLEQTAVRIRETVLGETGISVSIGGASQKMVAKMASGLAKPGGVHVVAAGEEGEFMRRFDLADIPGVGPALVDSLRRRGMIRVEDLLRVSGDDLVDWFGEGRGRWLYRRARGLDSTPITHGEERKSISSERTFHEDIDDDEALEAILLRLTRSVTRTLRRKELRARTVTVKLRDADFTTRQGSHTVPESVETDGAVFPIAMELLRTLRKRRRRPARLLGVGLSNLVTADEEGQLALFDDPAAMSERDRERDRALSRTVDALAERFGDDAVVPGRILGRTARTPLRMDQEPGEESESS